MNELARVRLSGDVSGDYVVIQERAGRVLQVAPEQPNGLPKVVALNKTCFACPAQWEGTLEDGRTIYARYRSGALSVGIGDDLDDAIENGWTDHALYSDYVGDALLEFPADLVVENEREPEWDLEALEKLLGPRRDDDPPSS